MKALFLLTILAGCTQAASVNVPMYLTAEGAKPGAYVGTVLAQDTSKGVLLTPDLHHLTPYLTPGNHGFH
ncbi:hypothetical protein ABTM14_19970, partial [Acinetobacter baumannii]